MKEPELYKPAEACRVAEVAPYVLRYWETEFPALAEGREKGASRLYTGRDVKVIRRIRELLYDEGFTVAGAKKRLEAEISEGRFDDGLETAPPPDQQKQPPKNEAKKPARPTGAVPASASAADIHPTPVVESGETAFLSDILLVPGGAPRTVAPSAPARSAAPSHAPAASPPAAKAPATSPGQDFPDRKRVVRELKDIVKLLDRAGRKTR